MTKMPKRLNKALFLDIDGVVVYDPGYLSRPEELCFLPNVTKSLKNAQNLSYLLIFISNKGGAFVKKGLTEEGLNVLDATFKVMLKDNGLDIKQIATFYCPHYPAKGEKCACRKPRDGLFRQAIDKFNIDTTKSYVIVDKISDLVPGVNLGCKKAFLVSRNSQKRINNEEVRSLFCCKYLNLFEVLKSLAIS